MILIYTHHITPRVEYAFRMMLTELLGIEVAFTDQKMGFISAFALKINYSHEILENIPHIIPHGLLHSDKIDPTLDVKYASTAADEHLLFAQDMDTRDDLGFDIATATFYLLSRYEEYIEPQSFYDYKKSIAYKHDFLKLPIIHIWVKKLKAVLLNYYPALDFNQDRYRHQLTYDIDHLHAFKDKKMTIQYMRLAQDFFFNQTQYRQRKAVLFDGQVDPWMNFDFQKSINQYVEKVHYFFHCGIEKNKYDNSTSTTHIDFQYAIKTLQDTHAQIGLHPSYKSNDQLDILQKEKKSLEVYLREPITASRQHYLFLRLPDTYRNLVSLGITDDYTMGYSHSTGFRAGIAVPFLWFDLERNICSDLRLHPFCVMDTTLKHHLGLSPEEGLDHIRYYISICKLYEAEFCSLWHNSSLGENFGWQGWRQVLEQMVKLAS